MRPSESRRETRVERKIHVSRRDSDKGKFHIQLRKSYLSLLKHASAAATPTTATAKFFVTIMQAKNCCLQSALKPRATRRQIRVLKGSTAREIRAQLSR